VPSAGIKIGAGQRPSMAYYQALLLASGTCYESHLFLECIKFWHRLSQAEICGLAKQVP